MMVVSVVLHTHIHIHVYIGMQFDWPRWHEYSSDYERRQYTTKAIGICNQVVFFLSFFPSYELACNNLPVSYAMWRRMRPAALFFSSEIKGRKKRRAVWFPSRCLTITLYNKRSNGAHRRRRKKERRNLTHMTGMNMVIVVSAIGLSIAPEYSNHRIKAK